MAKLCIFVFILYLATRVYSFAPTKEYKHFADTVLSKAKLDPTKQNYVIPMEVGPIPDAPKKSIYVTNVFLNKRDADRMVTSTTREQVGFKLKKRKKSDSTYVQAALADGWISANGENSAKMGTVQSIQDNVYVYDIQLKSKPGHYLEKGQIGLPQLFAIAVALCKSVGITTLKLNDASRFFSENLYGGKSLIADAKMLRAFQGKFENDEPSIYSKAGFDYTDSTRTDVIADQKKLHDITATQVWDKLTTTEEKNRMANCFRGQYWRIAWHGLGRDKSFKKRVKKFGKGLAAMWTKRKEDSQKCYNDIINILFSKGFFDGMKILTVTDTFQILLTPHIPMTLTLTPESPIPPVTFTAHIGFDNILSARQVYDDLLADYEYDVAIEKLREKRVMKRLRSEKKAVLRAKAKVKKKGKRGPEQEQIDE
eukprot:129719_1